MLHVARVDPELPVARPTPAVEAQGHLVRLFARLQGRHWGPELPDGAVRAYGPRTPGSTSRSAASSIPRRAVSCSGT